MVLIRWVDARGHGGCILILPCRVRMEAMHLDTHDRGVLRELAERLAAHAARPIQRQREAAWRRHNALQPGRPLVILDVEPPMWRELLPEAGLRCRDPEARHEEDEMRKLLHHADAIDDDWVIPARWYLHMRFTGTDFGLIPHEERSGTGAAHFRPVIVDKRDIERIRTPPIACDHAAERLRREALHDAIGDLLPVELRGYFVPWFAPIDLLGQLRGIGQLYEDLSDDPAWVHEALERLTVAHLEMLDALERQEALWPNCRSHFIGSGGQGFVDELPDDPHPVRAGHLWGQAAAQLFAEVSPRMHAEFSLPYDRRWLERFGLACYGCCEPLHRKVGILRTIPNLRRISLSPKSDPIAGARAIGRDYVCSVKPNPIQLAGDGFDEAGIRDWFRQVLEGTRGSVVEFVMKDTMTCRHDASRPGRWARIAREEIDRAGWTHDPA
jgi:hypothetical protein